jgi:FlaA1/EpsC-like NDP-sugar epimerase
LVLLDIVPGMGDSACPEACERVTGSVADAALLDDLFLTFRPQVVYHAAALKYVPALESDPFAAVRTNALGTYKLARAALRHDASRLALVSTDKAVNPHSVMGASKRLAELIVASLSTSTCRMNAVRLGNVIGSTGSVVPIFSDQIARRETVTVTHPEARRYFLSLDEAVEAILAAGAADCSGRVLIPDLGEPESIADLAHFLIHAAGHGASDGGVRFTGLRPGEKLTEDLAYAHEASERRVFDSLEVIRTSAPAPDELQARMGEIARHAAAEDLPALIEEISALIPEYRPSSAILDAVTAPQ